MLQVVWAEGTPGTPSLPHVGPACGRRKECDETLETGGVWMGTVAGWAGVRPAGEGEETLRSEQDAE